MNWLRKNSFITMMVIVSIFVVVIGFTTNEKIVHTQTINVSEGDTLWSLADQYRGKMTKHEWVKHVEKLNHVNAKQVAAGGTLEIPVIEESNYLMQIQQDDQNVKVAKK